jgi:hypothetical protein
MQGLTAPLGDSDPGLVNQHLKIGNQQLKGSGLISPPLSGLASLAYTINDILF